MTPTKGGVAFTPASQSVVIAGGVSVGGTNFTAVSTLTVSGTISPAASGSGTTLTLTGGATATADASGNYTFTAVPNGTYTVTPTKAGFSFTPASQSVTVSGASVSAVNFAVQPVTITGTVTPAASGSGATLTLAGPTNATATADAAGAYAFSTLPDGSYTVTPSKTGFTFSPASRTITISGASAAAIDFTATAIPTFAVSGTVSPAASGSGATLTLSGAASATIAADAAGNYSFSGLVDGVYTLTPGKTGFTFTPASQSMTVSGANVSAVNFTAQPVTISGALSPAAIGTGATVTLAGPTSATATADAAGAFTFSALPNGTYTVTPTKSGVTFTPASRSVVISGGVSMSGTDFTAVSTLTVSGTISPAASGSGTTLTLTGGATATANASGAYTFTGVTNGTYTVTPTKAGFSFTPSSQVITVSGANVSAVNFAAQPVTISGTITAAADGSGATLTLAGPTNATATADAAGAYSFSTLPDGSYTVTPSKTGFTFSPASRSVTISGASVAATDFTAAAISTFAVSGTVSPAASGSGAILTLSGGASQTVAADAAGSYSFSGLANGSYTVTPSKSGFTFTPASQTVTLIDGNVLAVNFTAQPVIITGVITPAASGAGTTVTLTGAATATATADTAGGFTFSALPNGTYAVTPTKSGTTFTPASRSVVISGGVSVSAVDFTANVTFSVSGTVNPAASASGTTLALSGGGTVTANASGTYTFTAVANGSYTVTPTKAGFTFTPASQAIIVNGANVTAVDFTAQPVTITGTITPAADASGATLTRTGGATTTVDATGAFTFSGVPNGTYTITPSKIGFNFTPPTKSVTITNGVSVSGVTFTAAAAPTSLSIDVTNTVGRSTRSTSMLSGTFSTTAGNELLLAFVSTDNVSTVPTTVTNVTGGGLTWTLVRRTNAQRGDAEIWRAFAPGALTGVRVTATLSQGVSAAITVMSFKGVDTTGTNGSGAIGATGSANAPSGAPSASLVTTRNNSYVVGVGSDWDGAIARTLGPGQTLVSQFLAADGDTFWVQRTTNTVPAVGTTVTINDTAPTTDRYNLTIVEILPPSVP